jgi:cysteine desulfurase family protein (TIGR01976 family)
MTFSPALLDHVRAQFPALADGYVYMDNAGGSLVLADVARRVADYLVHHPVQLGASYAPSQTAAAKVAEGRAAIATMVNAERGEEIVLGASVTQLMGQLAEALVQTWQPGDRIVVTDFDHEANIGPWRRLASRGIEVDTWHIDPAAGAPDLNALQALLTPRTRLVAMTHASNILGAIMPVRAVADMVHANGTQLCVDGVAFAPHRAVDVRALGADYYGLALYKVYGPHHGVLYGRHDLLLAAGNINHFFYGDDKVPAKLEPGNPNYELTWSATGILDYLADLGARLGATGDARQRLETAFKAIAAHEAMLAERLLAYLRGRNDCTIHGPREADAAIRVPTIAFSLDGHAAADVVARIDPAGIGIRHGDFHSRRLIEALDRSPGIIRVSMVHYNTVEEVDRLIAALEAATG